MKDIEISVEPLAHAETFCVVTIFFFGLCFWIFCFWHWFCSFYFLVLFFIWFNLMLLVLFLIHLYIGCLLYISVLLTAVSEADNFTYVADVIYFWLFSFFLLICLFLLFFRWCWWESVTGDNVFVSVAYVTSFAAFLRMLLMLLIFLFFL